jgi:hypothetical protein
MKRHCCRGETPPSNRQRPFTAYFRAKSNLTCLPDIRNKCISLQSRFNFCFRGSGLFKRASNLESKPTYFLVAVTAKQGLKEEPAPKAECFSINSSCLVLSNRIPNLLYIAPSLLPPYGRNTIALQSMGSVSRGLCIFVAQQPRSPLAIPPLFSSPLSFSGIYGPRSYT